MAYFGSLKHPENGLIFRDFARPKKEYIEAISSLYTGFVFDRMGKHGSMSPQIKPLDMKSKLCGPALTVLGPDLSVRRMAINLARPGDVIVIAANGSIDYACFGDGTARKMRLKGLEGIVIDGVTRDVPRLIDQGFHTFCRGGSPRNYDYPVFSKYGAINVPVACGGVVVRPGDLIFGDGDGVLVIPQDYLPDLCDGIMEDFLAESAERVAMTECPVFPVESELRDLGYEFYDFQKSGE